jgi:hypothetical protein
MSKSSRCVILGSTFCAILYSPGSSASIRYRWELLDHFRQPLKLIRSDGSKFKTEFLPAHPPDYGLVDFNDRVLIRDLDGKLDADLAPLNGSRSYARVGPEGGADATIASHRRTDSCEAT